MLGGFSNSNPCDIRVEDVAVKVEDTIVLRGVSFKVEGGLTAFIGPNGAGKTTLLRVLAGILDYTGVVSLCGLDARRARRLTSYVPAYLQVDPYAKVEDVLEAYLYDVGSSRDPLDALRFLGLERLRGRRFNSLSGGEHKLVLIAGALARNPRVLLLDEPFSHLDIANQVKVAKLIREVSRGTTIVMAVHEPLYASIADLVGVIGSGRLVAFGRPEEVVRRNMLEGVYGVTLEEVALGSRLLVVPSL
jgi:ABC-type cobalamin/Fe3+-siderophores transport system ATPase subunit